MKKIGSLKLWCLAVLMVLFVGGVFAEQVRAEEKNDIYLVLIKDKECLDDWANSKGRFCEHHDELENETGTLKEPYMEDGFERWRDAKLPTSGEGWTYDIATNTLTLENYHGYRISAVPYDEKCKLTIKLIGDKTYV